MAETFEEKYAELVKVIPLNCNIVRGFIGPVLDVDTVGVNTPEGLVALPPFMNVEPIVNHYWEILVTGNNTVIVNAGKDSMLAYKRDDCGWIKDTSVKIDKPSTSRVLTLDSLRR